MKVADEVVIEDIVVTDNKILAPLESRFDLLYSDVWRY